MHVNSCAAQRISCQKYVNAAIAASGLTRQEFAEKCGIHSKKSLSDYIQGANCPNVDRLIAMYNLTGIMPDDYGVPLLEALDCVDQMRDMLINGRAISDFAKATHMDKIVIGKLIDGHPVTLTSLLKFRDTWVSDDIPKRMNDPNFRMQAQIHTPSTRSNKELRWIKEMWKTLAGSAKEIRAGFWVWYSDKLFRMELERIEGNRYIFRSIERANEQIFTSREVQIS